MTAPDPVLVAAVADLWRMPRPGAAGALVALAAQPTRPRMEILADLLDKGVPMLPPL